MAESLLLPVVRGVVSKAADALVQTIARMWGVDVDRRKLERHLLSVQSLLADAEMKSEANPAVRRWMKDLKAVAYEADDVLDDFQYEALRQEAQAGDPKATKMMRYFTLHSPLLFRLTVSSNLNKVLKRINELVTEMHTFGLVERMASPSPQPLYRQTHSALEESADIFGRDNDKEVVVKLLIDQQEQRDVQVLPIIGMGGLGKTTLAKMVYNDSKVQNHFELKMWHCVSDNFEAISIVRSIVELATNKICDLPDTIELLRGKLLEVVGRKRFLLVLDDVWNEERQKWEDDLKPLLCSSVGRPGSVIVVTSRSWQVASVMGTLPPHELACLSEDDSWELFSKRAFSKGVQKQAELITIGKIIVSKCKGLPLALKTMGGLMSSKHQIKEWESVAEGDRGGKDEVLSILKLSYMHLSSEMKQCFAFCAVFPKDYEMDKDELIQLWMANNFIHAEGTTDLALKGEFIFNELVWRSFIQDVGVKKINDDKYYTLPPYKKIVCKMHDLMHDLAKDVTDECAFAEELIQQKASVHNVCHVQLSLYGSGSKQQIMGIMKNFSSLRTLLTEPRPEHMDLKEFKVTSLRAMRCADPYVIYSKVISTRHLRFLDLSGSEIVRLSNSVCMLYSLQSLILNHCHSLQLLPEGMHTMRKLNHIYLFGCGSLKEMPPKLSLLHNLCTLTKFIVGTGDGFGIEELKDLKHLGNRLELFNLRKVISGSKANLHEKKNLTELLLYWGIDKEYNPLHDDVVSSNEEEVLESLVPHIELKTLGLHGYAGLSISRWMRDPQMFQCLRTLIISNCPSCEDLPPVWLSPSLEELRLEYMNNLTTLCKNINMGSAGYNTSLEIFPKLKTMWLYHLPEFERWAENNIGEPSSLLMFPRLQSLSIIGCNKIATLPESPALLFLSCWRELRAVEGQVPMSMPLGSLPSLVCLSIASLADLVMPARDLENQTRRPLDTLRCLSLSTDNGFISVFNLSKLRLGLGDRLAFVEHLDIGRCHNIVCWPVEEFRYLVRLRFLQIGYCTKLEGNGSSSNEILPLPQLESLTIKSCGSLLKIPKLPTSLGKMEINECKSLVALPSNLGDLANLSYLGLEHCDELKVLPDGMDGLTSLEGLGIGWCPEIKELPQGLLQRLPGLKFLDIMGCPDLQRRCCQGGEYFDFVSPIPDKDIPAVTEPQIKKSVKRFLPWCGDSLRC